MRQSTVPERGEDLREVLLVNLSAAEVDAMLGTIRFPHPLWPHPRVRGAGAALEMDWLVWLTVPFATAVSWVS